MQKIQTIQINGFTVLWSDQRENENDPKCEDNISAEANSAVGAEAKYRFSRTQCLDSAALQRWDLKNLRYALTQVVYGCSESIALINSRPVKRNIIEPLHIQWNVWFSFVCDLFKNMTNFKESTFNCRCMIITQFLLSNATRCAISTHFTELHSVRVHRVGVSRLPADQSSLWTATTLPLLDHWRRRH